MRPQSAAEDLRVDLGGVAEQADRHRFAARARGFDDRMRFIEARRGAVEVAQLDAPLDALRPAFDDQHRRAGQHAGERLRAAHAAQARGENPLAGEAAAVMLAARLGEGLVGAGDDALAADVEPRAGGHLAEHHQPLALQLIEVLRRGPVRDEVGVGDEHPRRARVGAHDAHRLARLDQQRLVGLQRRSAARSRRSTPSCAPPCRGRRRRRAPPGARRSPGRDCSSASAAGPPSARTGRSIVAPRGARITREGSRSVSGGMAAPIGSGVQRSGGGARGGRQRGERGIDGVAEAATISAISSGVATKGGAINT